MYLKGNTNASDSNIPLPRRFKKDFTLFLLPWVDVDVSNDFVVVVVEVVVLLAEDLFDEVSAGAGCEKLIKVRPELKLLRGDPACFPEVMDSK